MIPQWKGGFRNTTLAYCVAHQWKVRPVYTIDDMMQEFRILFWEFRKKYAKEVKDGPHWMGLWKTTLHNKVWKMARSNRRASRTVLMPDVEDTRTVPNGELLLELYIQEAPVELRTALLRVMHEGKEKKRGESPNEFLCRLAGISPMECNLAARARELIKP